MEKGLGTSLWFDLPAINLLDAMSFYEALLGWKFVQMKDSVETDYVMIQAGETLIGGLRRVSSKTDNGAEFGAPLLYFTVEKLQPKANRAKELGATLIGGPVELGRGRGVYQRLKDRENNLIALWAPS